MQIHAAQEPGADLLIRCKLEAAGVRPTRPRPALARAIFGAGDRHFTAETLYHETRAAYFAPTLRAPSFLSESWLDSRIGLVVIQTSGRGDEA
jgi:hypothetical protein